MLEVEGKGRCWMLRGAMEGEVTWGRAGRELPSLLTIGSLSASL